VLNVQTKVERSAVDAPSVPGGSLLLIPKVSSYNRWIKRPLDVVLAIVAVILLSPLLLLVTLSIPLTLGRGGVLYRQERIGRDGRSFVIYKFRSMTEDRRQSESRDYIGPERRKLHKHPDDPRHRPYGRFLRATSIDELPQLINIIKGEMSMVGPRPELTAVARREGFARHPRNLARPGLTGPFQISPLRSGNRISSGLHLDIDYVVDVRLTNDLKILVRTALIPFQRRGS